ncbi:MAG: hypothetical protein V3T83_12950 [Acidobacteriota bacterium]
MAWTVKGIVFERRIWTDIQRTGPMELDEDGLVSSVKYVVDGPWDRAEVDMAPRSVPRSPGLWQSKEEEMLQSVLPSMFVLGLAAFAALLLVLSRRSPPEKVAERLAAARALALAVGVQSVHFAEEAATGLHER